MSSSIRCSGPYMEAFSWKYNDYITIAKANYPPNGIDFPYGATSRAPTRNLAKFWGASVKGQVLAMYQQVEAFGNMVLPEMRSLLLTSNEDATTNFDGYLAKSLFVSDIGNDDFLNHYFVHLANPLHKKVPPSFYNLLVDQCTLYLKKLYKFGARKFLVFGLGVLGFIPNIIRSYSQDSKQCFEEFNEISVKYNAKVKTMVLQLNQELSGVYILYWDIYTNMRQVLDNPSEYVICLPGNLVCPDRSQYVFWDDFHPTDVANEILVKQAYRANYVHKVLVLTGFS
ncbi:hypothetical protein IFM89_026069 [Coptis chinensis]|uniref:GDSL esterase/lipase n=1 Tax=Coptis chinensis TaxID=261450 RepID=A0A835IFX5_9MAGN|nr:hypothetical protein IFM89_026069 [Coptis chinensis]